MLWGMNPAPKKDPGQPSVNWVDTPAESRTGELEATLKGKRDSNPVLRSLDGHPLPVHLPQPFDLPNLSKHKLARLTLCSHSFWAQLQAAPEPGFQLPQNQSFKPNFCANLFPSPTPRLFEGFQHSLFSIAVLGLLSS